MTRLLAAVLYVLAGVVLGVAFIATPAKFLAPSLSMGEALDVGRWTFHVLALIEWGLVVSVVTALLWPVAEHPPSRPIAWVCVLGVLAVLLSQTFGVRPVLDARVTEIIAGRSVPAGPWHAVYVGLEAAKVILLMTAGTVLTGGNAEAAANRTTLGRSGSPDVAARA